MSVGDTRLPALLEQFTGDLQSPIEDTRRRATDELYERIIAQYADVSEIYGFRRTRCIHENIQFKNNINKNIFIQKLIYCCFSYFR
jgi:hypothetical protein